MAFIPANIGGGSSSHTNLTPSNASPAAITSGTTYDALGNGYAIESYSTLTPNNSNPATITSGSIYKAGGAGYAVESITALVPQLEPTQLSSGTIYQCGHSGYAVASLNTVTPSNSSPVALTDRNSYIINHNGYAISSYSSVTPSNSSPVALTSGDIDKMGGNGYAIESYASITPSNSSPAWLAGSGDNLYKVSANGYAIASYSSKTPSDTSPASVSSGAIIKASSAGYLVKNTPVNIGVPDIVSQANMNGNASRSITVTKTPRYVIFLMTRNSDSTGRNYSWFYDVGKNAYSLIQYTADGYTHSENTGAPTAISATSSSVTVTNPTSATCRTHALIYY